MPKQQKERRFTAHRNNPAAPLIPRAENGDDEENTFRGPGGTDFDILEKLNSSEADGREQACHLLAALSLDHPKTLEALVEKDIPRLVHTHLTDINMGVKVAAVAAMRNLCTCGTEACRGLTAMGVVPTLATMINKAIAALNAAKLASTPSTIGVEQATAIIFNAASSILLLCEECDSAVDAALEYKVLTSMLNILTFPPESSAEVLIVAGHCLNVMTDGHKAATAEMRSIPGAADGLVQLVNSASHPAELRVLAASVVLNCATKDMFEEALRVVLPVLSSGLDFDCGAECVRVVREALANEGAEPAKEGGESQVERHTPPMLAEWKRKANAVGISFEVLTNAAYNVEPEGEDEAEGWEEVVEEDMDDAGVEGEAEHPGAVQAILDSGVLNKAIALTAGADPFLSSSDVMVRYGNDHINMLKHIQLAALSCCSNLFGAGGSQVSPAHAGDIWARLGSVYEEATKSEDVALLEGVTSTMGSLARAVQGQSPLPINISREFLVSIGHLCLNKSATISTRVNAIGILSTAGRISNDAQVDSGVATCLMAACADDAIEVVCEALNAMYDVYSEENRDSHFKAAGGSDRLEAVYQALKKNAPGQLKQLKADRMLKGHVKDTINNARRFIKYKREHGV